MRKELELWKFVYERLQRDEGVMLLVVAESSGSSPGRAGYKMAVAADGELCGSIGGGVMEVRLVEEARMYLLEPGTVATGFREQVHQKHSPNASGMICSGKQTVIYKTLIGRDLETVNLIIENRANRTPSVLLISQSFFRVQKSLPEAKEPQFHFSKDNEHNFHYREDLYSQDLLYIIGGGHCALALSELMSKLDFHISIFDDRSDLNTIEKNDFADRVSIIDDYTGIAGRIPNGEDAYVVVMTLGFASDKIVIKQLCDRNFKYFGVLGSKAKMVTLMRELREERMDANRLARIRTPIGIPINSRTPEEIAVSIAAEIIALRNANSKMSGSY